MPNLVQFVVRQAAFRLARRQPEISQPIAAKAPGNAERAVRKPPAGRTNRMFDRARQTSNAE